MAREAVSHYQRAAHLARRLHANAEAIRHIWRALRLLSSLRPDTSASWLFPTNAQIHETLGGLLYVTAQCEGALDAYETALETLASTGRENSVWHCPLERKHVYYGLNRWQGISEIIEESRLIPAQFGTPSQQALFFDPSMF